MTQIPGRGFVEQRLWSGRSLLSFGLTVVMVFALLAASSAQVQGDKRPISPGTPTPQPVVPRRAAPLPPPATVDETTLPVPPTVQWDGKLLTVDAENSKLSDVLVAIRDKTGATLELSGDPARERVFVHLGPGPAREIISDLLYGTQFDYIVLASDDDPDALRSVVVTPRGRDDISINTVVAGAADTDTETGGKVSILAGSAREGGGSHERAMRLMPGYSGPSKPTFQAEAEAALAEKAAQDASAADTNDASANAQNSSADSEAPQDAKNDQSSSSSGSPGVSSPAASTTETEPSPPTDRTPSSASASNSNDQSGVGSMIQNMTKMFEQRRQIQAQQNQPPQQPSSN